jgi:hypothetical protein
MTSKPEKKRTELRTVAPTEIPLPVHATVGMILGRLKQTFQGAENLSQREEMVKSQLDDNRLPLSGLMAEEQVDLELKLRGAYRLPAHWTIYEKASNLRTLRQEQDPVMLVARPGTGSTSPAFLLSKQEFLQPAGLKGLFNESNQDISTISAGGFKSRERKTKEWPGRDENDLLSQLAVPGGHQCGRRVHFCAKHVEVEFTAQQGLDELQLYAQTSSDTPMKVHLPLRDKVQELSRRLCSRLSLPLAEEPLRIPVTTVRCSNQLTSKVCPEESLEHRPSNQCSFSARKL